MLWLQAQRKGHAIHCSSWSQLAGRTDTRCIAAYVQPRWEESLARFHFECRPLPARPVTR
jgi:hypothetical protein